MTLEQIAMMAAAAKTLKEGGAVTVAIYGRSAPEVQLTGSTLAAAVGTTGVHVSVVAYGDGDYWRGGITWAGAAFFALYESHELPAIGYHLVDGHPVPITEEVQADA